MKSTKTGKVYIVGAGPGDIGLLTLKGLKCIKKSDVVVYDFHINAGILAFVAEEAELLYAGKRGGHHEMTQDQINQALVDRALEGKTVCRLKGGDPFVFGRGGEECEVLSARGIPFEVVPGISSAIAVPAYAGIPITHRRYSSSFAVITGNEDETKTDSKINWSELARGFDTLVFLMGVKNIAHITDNLIKYGKAADTPSAVIRWGTRTEQETLVGTLSEMPSLIKAENIRPPAVMVVGNTVRLRDTLRWFDVKPLFGKRVLITRPYTEDYEPLEEAGAEIFEFPTIKDVAPDDFTDLDNAIDKIGSYDWIVFTSKNGFKYFLDRLLQKGRDVRDMKGVRICAIGNKTAYAIGKYGIRVDMVPEEFNAEGLAEAFAKNSEIAGKRFLLPRAGNAREVFPLKVRESGGEIDTPVAYNTVRQEVHLKRLDRFLSEGKIGMLTFTSAATFNNFRENLGDNFPASIGGIAIAAIGPVTEKAITRAGLRVDVMPATATVSAMVEAIIGYYGG